MSQKCTRGSCGNYTNSSSGRCWQHEGERSAPTATLRGVGSTPPTSASVGVDDSLQGAQDALRVAIDDLGPDGMSETPYSEVCATVAMMYPPEVARELCTVELGHVPVEVERQIDSRWWG